MDGAGTTLRDKRRQLLLAISTVSPCATSSAELHTAEARSKVLQHSHHLLCQGVPLQLASVVLIVVWRAPRRILHRPSWTACLRQRNAISSHSSRALSWLSRHDRRQGSSSRHLAIPTYSSLQQRIHRAVVGVSRGCWSGTCIRRRGWCSIRRGAGLGTGGLPLHRRLRTWSACCMMSVNGQSNM
jgi:hypothetical protein